MLARQRHEFILEQVRRAGSARVRDLAEELHVSEMTVRRDLDLLATQQLIEKVHGGAARITDASSFEPGFAAKQRRQRAEKDAIAKDAVSLVRPGSAIGLSAGTTTWTFARRLRSIPNLTVVTNAPSVAQALYQSAAPDMSVVLTGGIRTPSDALVGPIATATLARLHVDALFLGVHGMDEGLGYSTPNLAEAEVNAAFIAAARRVVVLADHTKWGIRGLAQIAPLERAETVISDDRLPAAARAAFESAGTELMMATPLRAQDRQATA
jgi:DeoR/GlpR family transcriptional regulator of sugar metabolism